MLVRHLCDDLQVIRVNDGKIPIQFNRHPSDRQKYLKIKQKIKFGRQTHLEEVT
jgi:hypothetical protein